MLKKEEKSPWTAKKSKLRHEKKTKVQFPRGHLKKTFTESGQQDFHIEIK